MDYCLRCNKRFKNYYSLKTHEYRYHPYLKKAGTDGSNHSIVLEDKSSTISAGNEKEIFLKDQNQSDDKSEMTTVENKSEES